MFNLIEASWIPVRRAGGAHERLAPWQITDRYADDPVVALAAPRADFTGALTEFLIGLLQTTAAPEEEGKWRGWWREPPAPDVLNHAMAPFAHAFDLDGDGPRFLQDIDELEAEPTETAQLLIDAPGAQTLRNNADLFVKRGGVKGLCRPCAAIALYTLQTYAPSGGAGHRTSLRGGGPLTTLVVGIEPEQGRATLWSRLWPNILTRDHDLLEPDVAAPSGEAAIFPWLAPTRTSQPGAPATYPQDMHPLHVFWGMPRRIRLDFTAAERDACDLCGEADEVLVRTYRTRPHGTNYEGVWRHPLTPTVTRRDGTILPVHPGSGGINYRHWLGLAASRPVEGRAPAPAVAHFRQRREQRSGAGTGRLAAFGYDMDNMKARAWHESEMPLEPLPDDAELAEAVIGQTRGLIEAAAEAAATVTRQVRAALFDRPNDAKGDPGDIGERFWRESEDEFFAALHRLRIAIEAAPEDADAGEEVRRAWCATLERTGLRLFDDLVDTEALGMEDFRRAVLARQRLLRALRYGRSIHELLRLPMPEPYAFAPAAAAAAEERSSP